MIGMTPDLPHPPALTEPVLTRTMSIRWLMCGMMSALGLHQLLLWRFVDTMPIWAYGLGVAVIVGLCVGILRAMPSREGPSLATLLTCLSIALVLLILGGEGRFVYANIDWQVRLAALRDMTVHPWPFVYTVRAEPDVLRAPIGMFLVPALAAKALGSRAGDLAMLLQNGALLGTVLALGSTLFQTRRARMITCAIFMGFSGLDALGRILFRGGLSDHLENWAYLQYSSTITLVFWVPQHAMAGWIGAVGYLLWRAGKIPIGPWLALLPLTALWSPLGLIGAMPFAALAGVQALMRREVSANDLTLPLIATLLALPSLFYLGASGDSVGIRWMAIAPVQWGLFELFEVLVYVVPVALCAKALRFGRDTLVVLTIWLLAIPFVQIGWSTDFMMRGSICALAILAIMIADAWVEQPRARTVLFALLAIGSVTGLTEIRRALVYPAAPQVRCSLFKAWDQSFSDFPIDSYVAPLSAMPVLVRPVHPSPASAIEPARCWDGAWHHPDIPDK